MSDAIQVFVFRDGAYVGSEVFTEPEIIIGRGDGVHLSLDDDRVSGRHAMLSYENGQATLLKLSSGDVLVNRTRVDHTYVSARDEIQIGAHTLKIKFLAPKAPSLRPSSPQKSSAPVSRKNEPRAPSVLDDHAGFADELHTEAMTEVINTSQPVAPAWPEGQRGRGRGAPSAEDLLIQSEIGRAVSQVTGSIPISGSDVVSSQPLSEVYSGEAAVPRGRGSQPRRAEPAVDPRRAPTAARPREELYGSGPGVDGVWAETSQPETLQADPQDSGGFASIEQALDSTFSAIPPGPSRSEPKLGYEPKVPKPRVPQAQTQAPLGGRTPRPSVSTNDARAEDVRTGFLSAPPRAAAQEAVETVEVRRHQEMEAAKRAAPAPAQAKKKDAGVSPVPAVFEGLDGEHTAPRAPRPAELAMPKAQTLGHAELEEELDEYERDLDERPRYALFPLLVEQKDAKTNLPPEPQPVLELLAAAEGTVEATVLVRKGERAVLGQDFGRVPIPSAGFEGLKIARVVADGEAEIEFPGEAEGAIDLGGARTPLDKLKVPENAVSKKGATYRAKLKAGGSATISLGKVTFHLRFVRPPVLNTVESLQVDRQIPRAVGASLAFHFMALVLTAIISPGVSYSEGQREMWSDVKQEEVREVKPPEPPPPEEKPPEPVEQPPEEPPPVEEKAPKLQPKEKPGKPSGKASAPKGFSKEEVKSAGVLGALGKLNLAAPGPKSMVQAATNLDAVHAPGGSNFKVGALIGKLPTSRVSVGGGGGGGPITRGGAELIRGGAGLAQLGKRGGGEVRGKVGSITPSKIEAKGSISREEVAAVINQHLREVQYCYEKTLLKDPGLAGKLILEWVINENGSVGRVKEKLSTLKNPQVSQCISENLRRWQFPKPRGGIVIVSYPFIFNAVGF